MLRILAVVLPLIALIVWLGHANRQYASRLEASRELVQIEREEAKAERARAGRALVASQEAKAEKSKAEQQAQAHAARAKALEAKLAVREPIPDTCTVFVAEALERAEAYRSAYESQIVATAALQAAVDTLEPALRDLRAADAELDGAADRLVKASKRSFWQSLVPKVGIGAAAGINPRGRPDAVAGVTLSWPI